jgi:hypothetical protein
MVRHVGSNEIDDFLGSEHIEETITSKQEKLIFGGQCGGLQRQEVT